MSTKSDNILMAGIVLLNLALVMSASADVIACPKPSADASALFTILDDSLANKLIRAQAFLKTHSVPVDALNEVCETSLLHAERKHEYNVFHFLYSLYGRPDVNQYYPDVPFNLYEGALSYGNVNLISFVKREGGTVLQKFYPGTTDLAVAAKRNTDISVTRQLIRNGADVNHADEEGITALLWAAENPNLKVTLALIKAGADVNRADGAGQTPIMNLSRNPNSAVARALIQAGARVNQEDSFGLTALIHAASNPNLKVVQTLIKAGADVNHVSSNGTTAFSYAKYANPNPAVAQGIAAAGGH